MSDNNDVDQQQQQVMPNSNNNNNDPSTINPPTTPLQSSTTSPTTTTTTQSSSSPLSTTTTISSSQELNNNGHNMSQSSSDPPTTPTTPIASTSVSSPTSPASSTTTSLVDKAQQQQQQLQQQKKESDEQMEKIVLKFLKQKGYAKALSALKSEAPHTTATIEQMIVDIEKQDAMTTSNDKEILNEYLENTNLQRSNSRRYLHAYQSLTDWVYSSLDIYKNEVIQVLYPVFIHCYLELILKGFKEEARKFLGKYKSQHTHFHYDEVLVLQSLTSPDLIAQNEFAQRVLNHKFIIRLSQASFELLMKFLQDSELNLLAILNRFVNFKVYKGQPSITAPAIVDGVLQLDTSSAGKKGKRDDQQSVTGSKRRREESEDQDESSGKHSTDLLSANRIKPIRWETSVSSFESAQATAGAKEPGKRGRKKKSELEAARQMKQLAEEASRATPTLPSVCFYTMFNCKDELNTLEIAVPKNKHPGTYESNFDQTNGPIIAGGFSDSTIKCWNWNLITNRNSLSVNGDMMDGVSSSCGAANQHQNGGHVSAGNRRANSVNYQTLVGHCGPVYSLSFNSDQRWLLSSSEDGTARLWNVETGSNIVVYKGHQYAVWDVAFSPLDYVFATASHDRTARIWVTDRVTPVRVLAGHLSDVECVKFHPNSKYVATGSSDKTVRLWDIDTGECVRLFRGHYGSIHTLAFSHDGRYCASAGQDEQVYVWDIASGRHMYKFSGHTDQIWSLDFNHTDTILASSSLDCTIRLWDLTESTMNKMMSSTPASSAGAAKPDQKKILDDEENKRAIEKGPLKTLYTKQTPVYSLTYLQKDVLLAGGCFSL